MPGNRTGIFGEHQALGTEKEAARGAARPELTLVVAKIKSRPKPLPPDASRCCR